MKKRLLFTIIMLPFLQAVNAQSVGINTVVAPADPAKLVITKQNAPATVKIETPVSPVVGQVLTSDANGNARWESKQLNPNILYSGVNIQYAPTPTTLTLSTTTTNQNLRTAAIYTGANITLPEGIWAVYGSFKLNATSETTGSPATAGPLSTGEYIWTRVLIDDDDATVSVYSNIRASNPYLYDISGTWNPNYLFSGGITGPSSDGLSKGEIYIMNCNMTNLRGDVITVKTTPFYLKVNMEIYNNPSGRTYKVTGAGLPPSINGENRLTAIFAGKCPSQ